MSDQSMPADWEDAVRREGRAAFIRKEMARLGFWDAADAADPDVAAIRARIAELRDRLSPLLREIGELDAALLRAQDAEALLREIRRRRIERVRAEREARRAERARERRERAEADARWRAETVPHLGRAVSAGLRYHGGDPGRLEALGLPTVATAAELAAAIGITTAQLAWLGYDSRSATVDHYRRFTIPKRSGGERVIASPKPLLRTAQGWVLAQVLAPLPVHDAATAYRPGASVVGNARRHSGRGVVVRLDLRDFFPSITFRRVKGLFRAMGFNEGVATILALLSTEYPRVVLRVGDERRFVAHGERRLPQGACTSPAISNLLARRLDARLAGLARTWGFAYTRYADDLIFSHADPDAPVSRLLVAAGRVVEAEGFAVNTEKTLVQRAPRRQVVTGLVVNDEPRVSRADLRRFRAVAHLCATRGCQRMTEQMGRDARAYVTGFASWVRMVNPEQAEKLEPLVRIALAAE